MAAVRLSHSSIGDYFRSVSGVRQGCVLSPFLFAMFISEFQEKLQNSGLRGISMGSDFSDLLSLLYADDLNLFDDTVIGLQRKLDILHTFCRSWGLEVNMDKTEVLIFRNGGILRSYEKWLYNGEQLKTSTYYNYLGVLFSTRLSWTKCTHTLVSKASKALFALKSLFIKYPNMPVNLMFKLFDSKVKPVLLYGSEVWGFEERKSIEIFHSNFCKYVLGVGKQISNNGVLAECGRTHMYIYYYVRCISYWCKLLRMSEDRYPKQSYLYMKRLDSVGRVTWASYVKLLLNSFGFGFAWYSQDIGDVSLFISSFKDRLIDCDKQRIFGGINQSSRLVYFKEIKSLLHVEYYVSFINHKSVRRNLCLLRLNSLPLRCNVRGANIDMTCKMCDLGVNETVFHFSYECTAYHDIRNLYLPINSQYSLSTNYYNILTSTSKLTLLNCSHYISQALAFRKRGNS